MLRSLLIGLGCLLLLVGCGGGQGSVTALIPPPAGEVPAAELLCQLDRATRSFSGQLYLEQPDVSTCNPGRLSPEAAQFMMDRLNFLRRLHLLPPVALDPLLLERAQQAALMQVANNTLSHNPPPPGDALPKQEQWDPKWAILRWGQFWSSTDGRI